MKEARPQIAMILRLARFGVALVLLALASALLHNQSDLMKGISVVWLPNALSIGVLVCTKRKQWPVFFALAFLVDFLINMLYESGPGSAALFSSLNMLEILIASYFMHRVAVPEPDLTRSRQLRYFLLYGVFLAPAMASFLASLVIHVESGVPWGLAFRHWFAADVLGIAMVTPLYISVHERQRFFAKSWVEALGLLILLCGITVACFRLTHTPILWLVLLGLLLCGVRIGFSGSAAALLLVTFLGGSFTIQGFGPYTLGNHDDLPHRILLFQCFVAMCMLALYVTEVARTANRRLQASVAMNETRFRSLAETSRDVLVLAELDGTRMYVSPAAMELTGYKPEEMVGQTIFQDVHPDDMTAVQEMFSDLLGGKTTSPLAYRIRRRGGESRWIEVNARLSEVTDGERQNLVYVMRDIADRKEAEEELLKAFRVAEKLALVDGLTGLANRRLFDETLAREWQRSMREQVAISLLMIDVDQFKSFNDLYGHLAGDECLRAVADEVKSSIQRTTDLVARYGGEEFVAVLPNTSAEPAERVAERARLAVEARQIPHEGSPYGVVTISVGVATQVAEYEGDLNQLIEAADAALYRAKAGGRNRSET